MLISLSVPADNERGPQYMEQALAAIHQANLERLPIGFSFGIHEKTAVLFCQFLPELAAAVTGQLAAHYPTATIERLPDGAFARPAGFHTWTVQLRLCPDLFPLRRYPQFDDTLIAWPTRALAHSKARGTAGKSLVSVAGRVRPACV